MKACVIFNPVAKGEKARQFRAQLDLIATQATLLKTSHAGHGRELAAQAARDGFDTIVAAGGDGTLNEVLNGIGDADAFSQVRLGLLPLGTVNVFARELKIPLDASNAWNVVLGGRETKIDLPYAEFSKDGSLRRMYFAQLAGAGLDARAIELVDWQQKKMVGPLAYVIAGLKAMFGPQTQIVASADEKSFTGELVLIGNGARYGGEYQIFPGADFRDGQLDVCVFPRVGIWPVLGHGLSLLTRNQLREGKVQRLRAAEFTLTSAQPTPFELEGDLVGHLPAKFGIAPDKLRVLVP